MPVKVNARSQIDIAAIQNALKADSKLLNKVADDIVNQVRGLARAGKRMTPVGNRPLPAISQSYKEARKGGDTFRTINGKKVPLSGPDPRLADTDSQFFRPSARTSNLTYTGGMMNSLTKRVNPLAQEIQVFLQGQSSQGTDYDRILSYLINRLDEGYDIFQLSPQFQTRIVNEVRRAIFKKLRQAR
jgi:hypothetical protein